MSKKGQLKTDKRFKYEERNKIWKGVISKIVYNERINRSKNNRTCFLLF